MKNVFCFTHLNSDRTGVAWNPSGALVSSSMIIDDGYWHIETD